MALIDLGAAVLDIRLRILGLEPPHFIWHFGAPEETTEAGRRPGPRPTYNTEPTGVDWVMDLQDDKKILFRIEPASEMGNTANFAGTYVWQTDRPDIITVTEDPAEPGAAWVAATGVLGPAVLTVTATRDSDSQVFSGTGLVNVVGGDLATFALVPDESTLTEVTPDLP